MQKIFLCSVLCISFFACTTEPLPEPDPCGEKVILRMFVKDTLNLPYYFKTSQTHLNDTTLILTYEDLDRPSALVVITDEQRSMLPDSINILTVRAYNKRDSLVLVEQFKIGRDSCHVLFIEGPTSVTIR